jgi:UDP-GlcNAc:undecaprenyl-phosphate GlcNAc-1-phosphate transferase
MPALLTLVLVLLVCMAVTYLLTPAVRGFAIGIGAQTEVRERDIHSVPTPGLGGLAMYGGLAAALLVAYRLPVLDEILAQGDAAYRTWIAVLAGGGLLVLIGVIDDRFGMDALTKFAGQVTAAGITVLQDVQLVWVPLPDGGILSLPGDYGSILTILVIVATINAVNFIDGLDGLAAGVVGIAALAFLTYALYVATIGGLRQLLVPAVISALLAGACLGFLPHNFNPARLFMGDTGSMLLGFLLASSAISILAEAPPGALGEVNRFPTIMPLLIPIIVLVMPYADMLLAVVRRTYDGRSPFAPDRKHLHHRLMALGHSQRGAALIMYMWAAVFCFGVVGLSFIRTPLLGLVLFTAVVALAALVLMLLPQWRRRPVDRSSPDRAEKRLSEPA